MNIWYNTIFMNNFMVGNTIDTKPRAVSVQTDTCVCVYIPILQIFVQIAHLLFSEEVSTWYLQPVS